VTEPPSSTPVARVANARLEQPLFEIRRVFVGLERAWPYRTRVPLGRMTSKVPPNSATFWHKIWPALLSPT
jgi:hypothetical protein